jgi:hypothetical protein
MSMPLESTFDYFAVVPHDPEQRGQPWPARQRSRRGDENFPKSRLVGPTPSLQITDGGLTPNAGWNRGRWVPSVQRARITLSAADRARATVASASFHIDMGLIASLQPADTVYLSRTGSGGLAISVVRDETLLAAAGAVTTVPLGNDLVARYPTEFMQAVEALLREFDLTVSDSDWFGPLPEVPIEIRYGDQRRLLCRANIKLGPYRLFMDHGFYPGIPGVDASIAISRGGGVCSETAVISCAQLLDGGEIEVVEW